MEPLDGCHGGPEVPLRGHIYDPTTTYTYAMVDPAGAAPNPMIPTPTAAAPASLAPVDEQSAKSSAALSLMQLSGVPLGNYLLPQLHPQVRSHQTTQCLQTPRKAKREDGTPALEITSQSSPPKTPSKSTMSPVPGTFDDVDGQQAVEPEQELPAPTLPSPPQSSPLSDGFETSQGYGAIKQAPEKIVSSPILLTEIPDQLPMVEEDLSLESINYDRDGPDGHAILRLKPTEEQWKDFPNLLSFAQQLGADDDGCFKIQLPESLLDVVPEKGAQRVPAKAYRPRRIRKNNFWRVNTVPTEGIFSSFATGTPFSDNVVAAFEKLSKLFYKSRDRTIRDVRYRVDVPAWTSEQRRKAGVPDRSPIHPLKGDRLEGTKAIIPGIHTPYVYESGPHFGATFQIHAEDFRLVSLNHLYKGRKIWVVVPSTAVDVAEEALERNTKCSQFMRHRAEFFFPEKLKKLGIPFRIVDQRPGETIVILPDAYHEGFSTGYTLAEAKNYAQPGWNTDKYQACEESCMLDTAIPADFMRPLKPGEEQLDLCTGYKEETPDETSGEEKEEEKEEQASPQKQSPPPLKREYEETNLDMPENLEGGADGSHEAKRVKV